jgi:mono/diheme cytochrome c family protein/cbb3-type cytochrome oxidase cytochrome c subunit
VITFAWAPCLAQPATPQPHPVVAGFDRAVDVAADRLGHILLGELNCIACHDPGSRAGLITPRPAPDITNVAQRLRADYLERFIADPTRVKPGTTMPHTLGRLSDDERASTARAIAHFLRSLSDGPAPAAPPPDAESVHRGQRIFTSVGCVACHDPRDASGVEQPIASSTPLGRLQDKYHVSGLAEFLQNPLATRPGGRMPDMRLSPWEARDLAAFLMQGATPAAAASIEPSLIDTGRKAFATFGCVNCHAIEGVNIEMPNLPLADLKPDRKCLADNPPASPNYSLTTAQRDAVRAALTSKPQPFTPADRIVHDLVTFNCIACHARDNLGGIEADRNAHFHSDNENLGEQGRIPPTLTGVGAKLRPDWLRRVLSEGRSVRPYMLTRMPIFGHRNVSHLADLFAQVDTLDGPEPPKIADGKKHQEFKKVGRQLVGNQGVACVTCHRFQGEMPLTMAALDLSDAAERLRYPWFRAYLLAPQRFTPITIMPGFWPGGTSTRPDILEGQTDRQIAAIWEYLSDGANARLPDGLQHEPLVMEVRNEAVMLRRKYPNVGKRGIGVGYPHGVNLVFDAENIRLAEIWKGDFADAGAVWRGQGSGNVRLLGDQHVALPDGSCFALLDTATAPWPATTSRQRDVRFKGYRLDAQRRPQFLYRIGDIDVTDYPLDLADVSTGSARLRRTLTLKSPSPGSLLVLRLGQGADIAPAAEGGYRIGPLRITVTGAAAIEIVEEKGTKQLRAAVDLRPGEHTLQIDYHW